MGGEHGGTIVRSVGTSGGPVIEHREPSGNGSVQWVGWGGRGDWFVEGRRRVGNGDRGANGGQRGNDGMW